MPVTNIKRSIIELSTMINNEEVFVHFIDDKDLDRIVKRLTNAWNRPKVRFTRPVYFEEICEGLDPKRNYTMDDVYDNPNIFPEVTRALDAMHKMMQQFEFFTNTLEVNPTHTVIQYIASSFYDCMSGGTSKYELAMCRYLIEQLQIPLDEEVYPDKERWHTVKDFLEEIKDVPRYEQSALKLMNMKLLSP